MLKVITYESAILFKAGHVATTKDGTLIIRSGRKIKGVFAVGQWKYFVIEDTKHATS